MMPVQYDVEYGRSANDTEIRIGILVRKKYDEQKQRLELQQCKQLWKPVLVSRDFRDLNWLVLRECGVGNEDMDLFSGTKWPKMETMCLSSNIFDWAGLRNFGDWACLKYLNLSYTCIGNKGCKLLSKSSIPKLEKLYLYKCRIGNQGLKHLTKARLFQLKVLGLNYNSIGVDGWMFVEGSCWRLERIETIVIMPIVLTNYVQSISIVMMISVASRPDYCLNFVRNAEIRRILEGMLKDRKKEQMS